MTANDFTTKEKELLLEAMTRHVAYLRIYEHDKLSDSNCSTEEKKSIAKKSLLAKGIVRMLKASLGKS